MRIDVMIGEFWAEPNSSKNRKRCEYENVAYLLVSQVLESEINSRKVKLGGY